MRGFQPKTFREAVTKAVTLAAGQEPIPKGRKVSAGKDAIPWVGHISDAGEDDEGESEPSEAKRKSNSYAEVLKRLAKVEKAGKQGKKRREGKQNTERKEGGAAKDECYNCGKSGHWSRDCPEPKKRRGGKNTDSPKGSRNPKAENEQTPDSSAAQQDESAASQ